MSRHRTASQYSTVRHGQNRHCPTDLACKGCCSCVQQLHNQNRILRERVEKLMREAQEKDSLLAKLSKTISELEKRKEEFDEIDDFKLKVRDAIRKQLEDEKKAEEFILQERLENAKKEKKSLQESISNLQGQLQHKQQQTVGLKRELDAFQGKVLRLEDELAKREKEYDNLSAKFGQFKQKQRSLEGILQDKTQAINRMQKALSQTQQKFISEKAKAKNNEFEAERHQEQLKLKKMEINSLHKTAAEKMNSINNLTAEKEKLGKLVVELDSTVHTYSQLSNQLRQRILISEDYALQKELQYKQLEMDYYDSVYQRCP